jgi:hypothetical protein
VDRASCDGPTHVVRPHEWGTLFGAGRSSTGLMQAEDCAAAFGAGAVGADARCSVELPAGGLEECSEGLLAVRAVEGVQCG